MKNFIHHIVLTVSDSKRSANFYQKVLDWEISEQKEDYAYLTPNKSIYPKCDFMLVLGETRDRKVENNNYDRNILGLDHFAFQVDSMEELKMIEDRLKKFNIEMETGGITDDNFGGTAIFCTDPDGMKIEFHLK